MRAAVVTKFGGPDVLQIQEVPIPRPKENQILVRVRAIGLNFADIMGRFGVYPLTPSPPFILGLEFSGDVVAVGKAVNSFRGGERVMGYSRHGSHAEYVAVNENLAVELPASVSYEEGAATLVTFLTAYHGLVRLANIRKDEKLLIHAAAGGVGIATIQLAKHLGVEIFGTASTEEKLALARSHGAHHTINYLDQDFAAAIREATGGYGVDVVMDSVGGETFRKSWKLLAQMGRYVLYGVSAVTGKGALSKVKAATAFAHMRPIFPPHLMGINKGIFGFNLGTLVGKEAYMKEATREVLSLLEIGVLKPLIGSVYPFEEIVEAHRALQMRETVGKVIVTV